MKLVSNFQHQDIVLRAPPYLPNFMIWVLKGWSHQLAWKRVKRGFNLIKNIVLDQIFKARSRIMKLSIETFNNRRKFIYAFLTNPSQLPNLSLCIWTYVALERSIYIDENTRENMSILPVSFVLLTATQKSWRGLGSEAEATENAVAKSTMYARFNENKKLNREDKKCKMDHWKSTT